MVTKTYLPSKLCDSSSDGSESSDSSDRSDSSDSSNSSDRSNSSDSTDSSDSSDQKKLFLQKKTLFLAKKNTFFLVHQKKFHQKLTLKLGWHSKTQIMMKLKNPNCDDP